MLILQLISIHSYEMCIRTRCVAKNIIGRFPGILSFLFRCLHQKGQFLFLAQAFQAGMCFQPFCLHRNDQQWRIQYFLEGRAPTPKVGVLTYFAILVAKTAWKWKDLDPEGVPLRSANDQYKIRIYFRFIYFHYSWTKFSKPTKRHSDVTIP